MRRVPRARLGSLDYSNETTGVFVNLTDSAFATAGQTVQGHTATDATSGGGHVIGIDALGSITDVSGGSADDILLGGNTANTMHGGDGNDLLIGFGGNDQLFGDAGNDTFVYSVGDGRDVVDGGTGIDTQIVDGVTTAETFNINAIDPTHLGINIVAGFDNAVLATTANAAISDTNVEEILINLSTAGDTVIISAISPALALRPTPSPSTATAATTSSTSRRSPRMRTSCSTAPATAPQATP